MLEAASGLHGLSFSVAWNKKCNSMFAVSPPIDLSNPEFAQFRRWKPEVLDKTFFVTHILSVLVAGLAVRGQNVLWFTDEDDISANDERLGGLTRLFGWICSQYLTETLGNLRCGTTRCDDGSRQIEDFVAIPDLVAGAISEQMRLRSIDPPDSPGAFWMHRGDFSEKTREITWWFSRAGQPLSRIACVIDPSNEGAGLALSWFHFENQVDDWGGDAL